MRCRSDANACINGALSQSSCIPVCGLEFRSWGWGWRDNGEGLRGSASACTRPVLESGTLKKLEHYLVHNPGTKQFCRLLLKTCVYNLLLNVYWE